MNRRMVRINPLREMMSLQNTLERLFDENWQPTSADTFALPIDIVEDDKAYTVTTELPGVSQDNINIRLDNEYLNIEAEIPEQVIEKNNARTLVKERRYGKFSRRIHLAQPIEDDHIEATFEDGLLTLKLPKLPEVQPKTIQIKPNQKN